MMDRALRAIRDVVAGGGRVLFVGTKKAAAEYVAESAARCGQYYVNHRWLGGMLTNWKTIQGSIKRLKQMEERLGGDVQGLTKKEVLMLTREREKLDRALGGIKDMGGLPDIIFVIDVVKEKLAIEEANKLGIPVVAVVDSNADPRASPSRSRAMTTRSAPSPLLRQRRGGGARRHLAELGNSGADLGAQEDLRSRRCPRWRPRRRPRSSRRPSDAGPRHGGASRDFHGAPDPPARRAYLSRAHTGAIDMAEITAAMVRDLREKTGAGMMDCKKALVETNGDMEPRSTGCGRRASRRPPRSPAASRRRASVAVASDRQVAAMVEVNCRDRLRRPQRDLPGLRRGRGEARADGRRRCRGAEGRAVPRHGHTTQDELTRLISTIGENMTIRRAKVLRVPVGRGRDLHAQRGEAGLGKIGVLVALEAANELEALETLGRQIGMHVAAARPDALDIDAVEPAALEREKAVLREQAAGSGKKPEIIEKMIEGRIRKYYEEVVLLEQVWVHDGESRVKEVVKKAGGKLTGFARFQLGEGIEKPQGPDFASEVAAAVKG
jgi:elongation factor Ts